MMLKAVVMGSVLMLLQLVLTFFLFWGLVKNGDAGITSSFIRTEWPSDDIPLDNEVFAVPDGHNAPQQVSICIFEYLVQKIRLEKKIYYEFIHSAA